MGLTILWHSLFIFYCVVVFITVIRAEIVLQDEDTPEATVPQGKMIGSVKESRSGRRLYSFFDIPYAKPPERFALAEPAGNWEGVLDASRSKSQCPQAFPGLQMDTMIGFDGSEDCLHLNVYVPEDAVKAKKTMPVLVLLHPGMFIFGYGNMLRPMYLQDEDFVFVSFNYRIGALGFLTTNDDLAPPNRGLHDQILVLKWIQNNIAHFGGDPTKVTLIGISAGACSAHMLMLSPLSSGLYSSAILHSGTALSPWALEKHPVKTVKGFAAELKCPNSSNAEMIECLKKVPTEELVAAQLSRKWALGFTYRFLPTIETTGSNRIIPDSPEKLLEEGKFDKHPIVIGGIERDGLIGSATILEDEHLVDEFNNDWNTVAPYALMFDEDAEDHLTPEERNQISTKIRQFYFGDKLINRETLDNLTHLYSDFWFIRGIERSASLHAKHGATVYPYMFSYQGHYSFLHLQGITEHNEPTHGDDALYLFSTGFIPDLKKHPKDEEFSRKFVHLWLSFIMTGKPSATFGSAKDWHPLSPSEYPIKWYNIDEDTKYEEYPYEDRVKFWEDVIGSHFKL